MGGALTGGFRTQWCFSVIALEDGDLMQPRACAPLLKSFPDLDWNGSRFTVIYCY